MNAAPHPPRRVPLQLARSAAEAAIGGPPSCASECSAVRDVCVVEGTEGTVWVYNVLAVRGCERV